MRELGCNRALLTMTLIGADVAMPNIFKDFLDSTKEGSRDGSPQWGPGAKPR